MLRRRPDVREVERQLAADTARIGVAVADLYPRITLGASVSYLGNDSLKGSRAVSFALGPLISWTFPNTTAARSRIAQARAQGRASLARFDGVVLVALKESEQSLSTYKSAIEQRDAMLRARAHAENSFRLADQRYRAGSIGYLDVLTAQEDLIGTRAQVVAADQKVSSARVSVFKALGGGW
jgi:outer membrane protein TolC